MITYQHFLLTAAFVAAPSIIRTSFGWSPVVSPVVVGLKQSPIKLSKIALVIYFIPGCQRTSWFNQEAAYIVIIAWTSGIILAIIPRKSCTVMLYFLLYWIQNWNANFLTNSQKLNYSISSWSQCNQETRGQWPYRPAPKEKAMTNRPIILYDFNILGIHIKERGKMSCLGRGSNPGPHVHNPTP